MLYNYICFNYHFFLSEAWLRGRRASPPTTDELLHSAAIMDMKKRNAKLVEQQNPFVTDKEPVATQSNQFPIYSDYDLPDGKKRPGA